MRSLQVPEQGSYMTQAVSEEDKHGSLWWAHWTGTGSQQFRYEGLRSLKEPQIVEIEKRKERTEGKQTPLGEC